MAAKRVMLVKLVKFKISNFGAVGDGSEKGNLGKVGKIGKISNFGAIGDGRVKGNIGKITYCNQL